MKPITTPGSAISSSPVRERDYRTDPSPRISLRLLAPRCFLAAIAAVAQQLPNLTAPAAVSRLRFRSITNDYDGPAVKRAEGGQPIDALRPVLSSGRKHPEGHTSSRVGKNARSGSDRKSTRLNSSHVAISYAVFCLKK